jgi:hypothetical protein
MSQKDAIRLNNGRLEVRIDPGTGRVMAIRNLLSGLDLIDAVLDSPPWRIEIEHQDQWLERFTEFHSFFQETPEGQSVGLRWETEYGLSVTSRVHLPAGSDAVFFTVAIANQGILPIDKIEYPILSGIGALVRGVPADLAHSQGTGFLFHNPLRTFLPENGPKQGLRYSPYPEGFNGSTMQFMAYYAEQRGGFYFATRDSGKAMKWFNFYKDVRTAALFASIMHQAGQVEPGLSFDPGYEIEISALVEGTWYEAAERYKSWANHQPWTQQGPLHTHADRPGWLFENVGISTFGVNAAYDRSKWLDAFHQMAGVPVLHILGPNWANAGQDYVNHLPGGEMSAWLPAKFSAENLDAIRRNGDYWAPFEFDLLCSHSGDSPAPVMESRQVLPEKKYSFDHYWFPFMCPGTEFWRTFHAQRDSAVIRQHAPDGIYYDISANNVEMACRSRNHEHHPGGGQEIADAFANMFAETKTAMAQTAGHFVPIGTEMISELLIPQVDFYQARAEASPSSAFEADFWRAWVVEGKVEKIPLFAYVYHEYGPLRMDGWAKLAAEAGEVFYWVASRVTLWGGLFELNYEFSPLEMLDEQGDAPEQHYYPFEPRDYTINPEKAAFVGEVARARSGWANEYLAYGEMLRPPEFTAQPVKLSYHLYNCGKDLPHYGEKGEINVSSVVCAAWRSPSGRVAIFFSNLLKEPQTIHPCIDLVRYGLDRAAAVQVYRLDAVGAQPLGPLADLDALDLPPRRIIALELQT